VPSERSFWRLPSEPCFSIGSYVEYTDADIPELQVWRGHPGLVIDMQAWDPPEASVCLVGGPSMCFPVRELVALDAVTYRQRGDRIIAGKHPLEQRQVGAPITADGSHWP
jgi:hypothetical protein